ncbi:DNA repair protein RecO [Arcanobacterium bovis]|uniref:DNA repair protein RecO n=1 Tax=Arcanobacterium bovis TaxID=2529275 RepID=A0A4V2KR36_9ACTO|nr:DNA repair protein RecO [Arcanobacterium bovis]TBW22002.1 DNA repair protein RecO [Arcanobacterium bovis]
MNKTYRDQAIVLRTHDLGEADRIITMFSREHGKIRGIAKGVRKTKSRFGARLEPFSHVDVQLYYGRTLDVITQVETINEYHRSIITHYDLYTAASALLETADQLMSTEGEPDLAQFLLLHGALHAMATGAHHQDLILYSYILRAMKYSGWEFAVFECARCGVEGPHEALNVHIGGAVCADCRPAGCAIPSVETWQLLGALISGDWKIAALADEPTRKSAGAIIGAYLQWHMEKQVRSLKYVDSRLIS